MSSAANSPPKIKNDIMKKASHPRLTLQTVVQTKDEIFSAADSPSPSPTRRARKLSTMHRGMLRDKLRGSTKFHDSKYDLGVIRERIEDLQIKSEGYRLKHTKPVIKFYGSYNEML